MDALCHLRNANMAVLYQARSGIRTRDPVLTMHVLWPAELSGRGAHDSAEIAAWLAGPACPLRSPHLWLAAMNGVAKWTSSARARRLASVCLGTGALLALGVAPAGAVIKTASKSLTIHPGGTGSVAASCAAGTVPVSAGFMSSGFTFDSGGIVPFASVRLAGGSSATGRNVSTTVVGTLTDYAYCDTDLRAISTRSSSQVQLPINQPRTATASCPVGTVPISGGYRFTNAPHGTGAAFRSRKLPGGWQVGGYNGGPGTSAFTAFVYCQRNGLPLETRSSTKTIPRFMRGTVQAACPDGTTVFSGGFDGHLTTSPSLRVALPTASTRIQNSWRVTGAAGGTPTSTLTGFAYCEPL
jgi:hypothetical protein